MRHVLRLHSLSRSIFLMGCDLYSSVFRHRCYSTKGWHRHLTSCYKQNLCVSELSLLRSCTFFLPFNPLNAELNPICHLLALLGAHHIFHVSGLRVNGENAISLCVCRCKSDRFCERHYSVLRHPEIFRKLVTFFIIFWELRGHEVVELVEALRYKTEAPGVDSASNINEYQEYFLGGKGGRCLGPTTLSPSCVDCFEIRELQLPGTLRACPGLYRDCFAFTLTFA